MLVGGTVSFEKKNAKIALHFNNRRDVLLKDTGFALTCVADAESLVQDSDVEAEVEREIQQRRKSIETNGLLPEKEKEKALSNLTTGEVLKRTSEKARARLVYIEGQKLSRARFAESIAALQNCFAEIGILAGAIKE